MELGFNDLFTSYDMELETHVHVQIEKQLGFYEHQIAWSITMVEKLGDGTRV